MTYEGRPSPQFRWSDPDRTDEPQDVLAAEGVVFDASGRASDAQLMDARALADAAGVDIDDATITARRNRITKSDSSDSGHAAAQIQYWALLKEWCEQSAPHLTLGRTPRPQAWYDIGIGTSGTEISLAVNSIEQHVYARLWIANNKELQRYLLDRQDAIEAELGYPVEWDDKPGRKASKIIRVHDGDFRDVNQQADLIAWQGHSADDFGRVFPGYIRAWMLESSGADTLV